MKPLNNLPFYFKPIKHNFQKGHDGVKFIIIHDTANKSKGADASAHFNYFNSRYVGASADYFVDDKQIIQTVSDYNTSWHCGDNQGYGRALNGAKNRNSIGVEICVNSDGNYELAVANAIELVKNLQKLHGVPNSRVQRHYDVSRKRCAGTMISNNWAKWNQFKRDLSTPMILAIDTRTNSIAKTVSGGSTNIGATGGGTVVSNIYYGIGSPHNTKSGIQKLQQDLIALGHPVGKWGANGIMGNDTRDAIISFQEANKIKVDGFAGQGTLTLIDKLIEEKNKPKPATPTPSDLYRVRQSWANEKTQKGAYANLDRAIEKAKENEGYKVYDNRGAIVYPIDVVKPTPQVPTPDMETDKLKEELAKANATINKIKDIVK